MVIINFNFFIFYEEYFLWNRFVSCIQKNGKKTFILRQCRNIFYRLARLQYVNTFILFYEVMDIVKYYVEPKIATIGNMQIPFELSVSRQYFLGIKLLLSSVRHLIPQKGTSFFFLLEKELLNTILKKSIFVKQKSNYTKSLIKLKGKISWRNRFLPKQELLLVKFVVEDVGSVSDNFFLVKNLKFYFGLLFFYTYVVVVRFFVLLCCALLNLLEIFFSFITQKVFSLK